MSRPIVLHICLAFCSLVLLNFATQCVAFPKMERREIAHVHAEIGQPERMNTDDLENDSVTPRCTPQLVVSEDPMMVLAGPSATSLNKVFPTKKEAHPVGAGLMQPNSPDIYTATETVVPAKEEVFVSSQPETVSPESRLSDAVLTSPIPATAPLNIDKKEEHFGSTIIQPLVEGTTEATQGFLKYADDQLFASESQERVSLGHLPSSDVNTKEMLTANPRTEKSEADTEHRAAFFPGAEPIVGTEPGSPMPEREKPSQMTADHTQATATKHRLTTSEYTLSVEPETDRLLGAPGFPVSVSAAVPAASVSSDAWDDIKLEHLSQIKTPKLGDDIETQVGTETSQIAQETDNDPVEGMEEGKPVTEASDMALGLLEGEAPMGTALLMAQGEAPSSAFTDQSSFTPTSPVEDRKVSVVSLLQDTADFMESTRENDAMVFLETTVSISEYEAEARQPLGNPLKDIITQEMTTAVEETEATLSLVMQEQEVSTLEVTGENGKTEEGRGSLSATSAVPAVTQLSRRWEPRPTMVSATAVPLSFEVTSALEDLMDTLTRPNEELFTPVWGSPVTPPGIMEEAPSLFPVLPDAEASSERRTVVPSISHVNTAASYGLDQLESEEGEEDEDEEDEEEEDEEEEAEEEDEEDHDAEPLDESLDGDAELPGFTLPGITSQEPGSEQGNLGPLDGATYQVPDAIEWEQQNQGLVRGWMEKLKDKAGYMSGMLVPVGVGIAGALFILGALYSIKVMNRRRRNGFKRHKRKQREFNSMQDRVMLLADSSEDEF
ncbi:armadillo-like helical domain-containing protein 4 isoform X1 [Ailuropoda melanoleuca]|nr:armadillo-like helical domain-containing protein 4 isoform X1 [Ailuropoda melanoleuca]XP_034497927.1 armadillo-like helical domain-containing protein 4 isoform X1 [Ailuropoda melanoleuca]XP_034497928.1 armadillo-like helical domain-containing protein 4 isoform X1 [Ailuropoda melanoleuca]XP_034497929.1 armadillo-like helical domain-containing protein 4 isoform X1 [Ailuropoda melanoleuca]